MPQMKSSSRPTAPSLLDGDPNAAYVADPGVKLVEFRASRKWRNRILGKLRLSLTNVDAQRRPPVSPQDVAVFVERMTLTLKRFCLWRIVSIDETLWKVIETHAYQLSMRGIGEVKALFSGDPKMCLTAAISISATGDRLLMWVIGKGRTDRCE
jgi:hypothetical protein